MQEEERVGSSLFYIHNKGLFRDGSCVRVRSKGKAGIEEPAGNHHGSGCTCGAETPWTCHDQLPGAQASVERNELLQVFACIRCYLEMVCPEAVLPAGDLFLFS